MFDAKELRRVMGLFATGVTVITTRDSAGNFYGLTANAVTSLSLVPPLLLICVDRKAETFPHFLDSGVFIVNVLGEDQEAVSRHFAKSGGAKFVSIPHRPGQCGTPVIEGAIAHLECRIVETHEGGDHVIHVGQVEHAETRGGAPLLFFQGQYRRLAPA
jgi:flavin reductase (DIM6/NTAB) family NADH-FMN oxidoreductase RutF